MKTAKKKRRVLEAIDKFSKKSAEVLQRFRNGLAGIWREEGEKKAESMFGGSYEIIKKEGFISERKRNGEETEEEKKEGLFRKARPPPLRRGKKQQKSQKAVTV